MSKFERKFGKYAIKNISMVLLLCYAAGFIMGMINMDFLNYLRLNPYAIIFQGQIWRLVTWIIIPPQLGGNLFLVVISLIFYYSIGSSLERTMGTYRYNVYLISGMLITVISAFGLMAYLYLFNPEYVMVPLQAQANLGAISELFSTYYINLSIFLAYATIFADAQVMLMFVIPIKVKYLGIVYAIMLAVQFVQANLGDRVLTLSYRVVILASMLNFIIFFLRSRKISHLTPRQIKRRQDFRHEIKKGKLITRHQCAICGVTEEQDPTREFRFCSKCAGNYEYCDKHLFTHTHIKE